jgi:chromosome partitioning protein
VTATVSPGLGWPSAPRGTGPDVASAPSDLGWPAAPPPGPAATPATPADPPGTATVTPGDPAATPPAEPSTSGGDPAEEPGTAYRQSLVREAMARVATPKTPADVSRETWHDAALGGHHVEVSRETAKVDLTPDESELAKFLGADDTPIAKAAASALRTVRGEPFPKPAQPRLLTVANQKGGVGKTTTAVNIAAALALRGLRVLVIDLDPQGNASTALGVEHHEGVASVYETLVSDRPLAEVVQQTPIEGLFCVPATVDLAGAEIELVSVVAREGRLKRAIAADDGAYDYVFVDCPPSLGLLTVNALVAAQEIVIPIQCEFYALEGLGQLLRNVELIRSHLNSDLWVSTILLTMYDGRTRLADQVASEVRSHFGELVLDAAIPRSVRISEAPGYGQTVLTYDPASRGAQAYLAAAREMAERGARMEGTR